MSSKPSRAHSTRSQGATAAQGAIEAQDALEAQGAIEAQGALEAQGCVAVILAAGQSRRFGALDKRLHVLPDGQTMLAAVYAQACQVFDQVLVVIRDRDQPSALGLPSEAKSLVALHADKGMGHSLAEAFCHLSEQEEYHGFDSAAVILADMPFIQSVTLQRLKRAANRQRIVRPSYRLKDRQIQGGQSQHNAVQNSSPKRGHPVLFGRDFWGDLHHLEGDQGARHYLSLVGHQVTYLEGQDAGILQDIDSADAVGIGLPHAN